MVLLHWDHFAAVLGHHRGQRGDGNRLRHEAHGAVAEGDVGAAHVEAVHVPAQVVAVHRAGAVFIGAAVRVGAGDGDAVVRVGPDGAGGPRGQALAAAV